MNFLAFVDVGSKASNWRTTWGKFSFFILVNSNLWITIFNNKIWENLKYFDSYSYVTIYFFVNADIHQFYKYFLFTAFLGILSFYFSYLRQASLSFSFQSWCTFKYQKCVLHTRSCAGIVRRWPNGVWSQLIQPSCCNSDKIR